ncbi:hypothetical protein BHM03_00020707 [Ensete ventricosum]|nr:hypothetical protein BHM03_00020707 [Ensete ventricosum]
MERRPSTSTDGVVELEAFGFRGGRHLPRLCVGIHLAHALFHLCKDSFEPKATQWIAHSPRGDGLFLVNGPHRMRANKAF